MFIRSSLAWMFSSCLKNVLKGDFHGDENQIEMQGCCSVTRVLNSNCGFLISFQLKDDNKPMIEIMDQLSPVILDSFINVAVSDTVSYSLT